VTFTTASRTAFFYDLFNAREVAQVICNTDFAQTFAFVVMPDHVHWLLQLGGNGQLSAVVQYVKSVSAHRLNKRLGRRGPVWQDGFHDRALRRDEDLKMVARYILGNPVRAGLAETVAEYSHWDAIWL
jgi:REP element-mobilizing transposase RayT